MPNRLRLCLLDARRAGQGGASAGADGLTAHLDYGRHDRAGHGSGNSRNGTIAKTVYAHGMSVRDILDRYFQPKSNAKQLNLARAMRGQ